jgi:hypothetical protein
VPDYNASIAVINNSKLLKISFRKTNKCFYLFFLNILTDNVLITPFKNKIIPPPMSLHKLVLQFPVNNLIWSEFSMDLMIYLMNGDLVCYKFNSQTEKKGGSYELYGQTR